MTPSMLRRYENAQESMVKAVMPKSGVVEYDDLIQRLPRTGKVWRMVQSQVRVKDLVGSKEN